MPSISIVFHRSPAARLLGAAALALCVAASAACSKKSTTGPAGEGAIIGRVTVDGQGAAGVAITVRRGTQVAGMATTDGGGSYHIQSLIVGAYAVSIEPPAQTVCVNTQVNLTLLAGLTVTADFQCVHPPGAISGQVTSGGQPVGGATVVAIGPVTRGTMANAAGEFLLGDLPAGSYTVLAEAAGFGCFVETAAVEPGQTTTANVACAALLGEIRGRVTSDGEPLFLQAVTILQGQTVIAVVGTNAAGIYQASNLEAGVYIVSIEPPPGIFCTRTSSAATVQAGQTTTVDFICTAQPSPPPSENEVQGPWLFTLVRSSAVGDCPAPLPGETAVSITFDFENQLLRIANLAAQIPIVGPYDSLTGEFEGGGSTKGPPAVGYALQGFFFTRLGAMGFDGTLVVTHATAAGVSCTEDYQVTGRRP